MSYFDEVVDRCPPGRRRKRPKDGNRHLRHGGCGQPMRNTNVRHEVTCELCLDAMGVENDEEAAP